jgi:hypothetical protein
MRPNRRLIREERASLPGPTAEAEELLPGAGKDQGQGSARYAWIGAGQCGGRLAKSFYDLGYQKVLAVDTTGYDLALLDLPESQKLLLGEGRDKHNATDAEEAARVLKQHRQDLLHLAQRTFAEQVDRLMICCGAGGSTGGGSVFELIEAAKRYARYIGRKSPSRNVGVLVALPDARELCSAGVARNARRVATTLCQMAAAGEISPLLLVDNQKVGRIQPGTTGPWFWSGINRTVASLFDAFNRLSNRSSPYTCFDPADYDTIMSAGGCLIMGAAQVDRFDDPLAVSQAVADSLQTTLFAGGDDLSTAKVAGCVVVGGQKVMARTKGLQDNIDYAFDVLSEVTGRAIPHRGIYEDQIDGLRVFTIIGGLPIPQARLMEMEAEPYSPPEPVDTAPKRPDDMLFAAEHVPDDTTSKRPDDMLSAAERRPADTTPKRPDDMMSTAERRPADTTPKRPDDIMSVAERLLAEQAKAHRGRLKTFGPDIKTLLANYSWPGGGPELAAAIKHAYKAAAGPQIPPEALPYEIIFADRELYREPAWPTLDMVQRRWASKAYDEWLQRLEW